MLGACSMVLRDASLAAPLRLIWAGLDLHRPPFAPPPYSVESAASASAPQVACFTTSKGDGGFQYNWFQDVLHYTMCLGGLIRSTGHGQLLKMILPCLARKQY